MRKLPQMHTEIKAVNLASTDSFHKSYYNYFSLSHSSRISSNLATMRFDWQKKNTPYRNFPRSFLTYT